MRYPGFIAILTLPILLTAASSSAAEYVYLIPAESPVHFTQEFELDLPPDANAIHSITMVAAGDFLGTLWVCNLETPDPGEGPGGLAFAVSGLAEDGSPTGSVSWVAERGPFETHLPVPPPPGGWDFLVTEGALVLRVDEYIPATWNCYDRCPHGCSNVSGFAELSSLQMIVEYDRTVATDEPSWGTLKARW